MVHAIKFTWKLGFGHVSAHNAARLHAALEAGYFIGSLLFAIGTVFFYPMEKLENFRLGCKFYELGSVLFALLTLYSELDRYHARRRADAEREITKRELIEQLLYCSGSFVFLVGTFLFDPPIVESLASMLHLPGTEIENVAAVMFMVGSFMFSLGSYVNALSIFQAPSIFRLHLISVTTCYQFGGLFFIAGTMGYVEAFEPNLTMRWVSTWLYMVGCFFYVAGSFLAFVSTVASHQVRWERLQKSEEKKRRSMATIVGRASSAIPRAFQAARRRSAAHFANRGSKDTSVAQSTEDTGVNLEEFAEFNDVVEEPDNLDLEVAEGQLAEQLSAVLGPDAGRELAAVLRDGDGPLEEDGVFNAFWRSVWSTELGQAATDGVRVMSPTSRASFPHANGFGDDGSTIREDALELSSGSGIRDNLSLLQEQS